MSDDPQPRRKSGLRIGISVALSVLVSLTIAAVIGIYLGLWLGGRVIVLPDALAQKISSSVNGRISRGGIDIGEIGVAVGEDKVPRLVLFDVSAADGAGGARAAVTELNARLAPEAILRGGLGISDLRILGAQLTVRRDTDGQFSVDFGGSGGGSGGTFAEILAGLDKSLSRPGLSSVTQVAGEDLNIALEDARSGRIWQATGARAVIRRADDRLSMTVATDVFNGTDDLAELQISASYREDTGSTSIAVRLKDVRARDLAVQSPALAWLEALQAPISGAVRATFEGDGTFRALAGTLNLGAGALQPTEASRPIGFDSAEVYFDVDPEAERINFTNVAVNSDAGFLTAQGTTDVVGLSTGWPQAFIGQFEVSEASYVGDGQFERPLIVDEGLADLRLRLDPFRLDFGQVMIRAGEDRILADAKVLADDEGWSLDLNATATRLGADRLFASWPVALTPGSRRWLARNIQAGTLTDVAAAVRSRPGSAPDIGLSFGFEEATLSYLGAFPPVSRASGAASLVGDAFTLRVDEGGVDVPSRGWVNGSGSVFHIRDIKEKPARAILSLRTDGSLGATLDLADRRPVRALERAGRDPSIASGLAQVRATIQFPLKGGMTPDDISYDVTATATDVESQTLVPGRRLASEKLDIAVSKSEVAITGAARLDGVPLTGGFQLPIGVAGARPSLSGQVQLTPAALKTFGIVLPPEYVSGSSAADWQLDLRADAPPRLTVTSNLVGSELSFSPLGFRKPPSVAGGLELTVDLGDRPTVPSLALSAPGLAAEGRVELSENGGLDALRFDRIRIGSALDAGVTIRPGGSGQAPDIRITNGSFDLSRATFGNGAGGGGAPRITFDLDRFRVSEGITLAPVSGNLRISNGIEGRFAGAVNGEGQVSGELIPYFGRTALRLTSGDAGQVVRAAGLLKNVYGGTLGLTMVPRGTGTYEGQFEISDIRLRKAPVMADLLDAISVVGLLNQLDGPGIVFNSVDGAFLLTEDRLTLQNAAATGGSLGVSLDGVYDLAAKRLNMQGVISPIYFLNSIGQIFTRRGEGLFGFSFRLTGDASEPQITVNPLSILTPGMFREIFRSAPPSQ